MPQAIAYFITPHGYGHAARACAIMAALHQKHPAFHFHIFTQTPRWFIAVSLQHPDGTRIPFTYHDVRTDVGMIQQNALHEDLAATLPHLEAFFPFDVRWVATLAQAVTDHQCRAVFCDIAPLGIAVAEAAGLPSVLVENFTWDWIYEAYRATTPEIAPVVSYVREVFRRVTVLLQAQPAAPHFAVRPPDGTVAPISRTRRMSRATVRDQLGLASDAPTLLLTMGGTHWQYDNLERLARFGETQFIIPGAPAAATPPNVHALPHNSVFFHPDLIHASDGVIGKIGYSTFAEVYQAGIPFGYIPRARFGESAVIEAFIRAHLPHHRIPEAALLDTRWEDHIPFVLAQSSVPPPTTDGGAEVVAHLERLLPALFG